MFESKKRMPSFPVLTPEMAPLLTDSTSVALEPIVTDGIQDVVPDPLVDNT